MTDTRTHPDISQKEVQRWADRVELWGEKPPLNAEANAVVELLLALRERLTEVERQREESDDYALKCRRARGEWFKTAKAAQEEVARYREVLREAATELSMLGRELEDLDKGRRHGVSTLLDNGLMQRIEDLLSGERPQPAPSVQPKQRPEHEPGVIDQASTTAPSVQPAVEPDAKEQI